MLHQKHESVLLMTHEQSRTRLCATEVAEVPWNLISPTSHKHIYIYSGGRKETATLKLRTYTGLLCENEVVLLIESLVAQLVKNPPAMQETWVRSLGWEDALQKGTATHSSILAWRIPWTV